VTLVAFFLAGLVVAAVVWAGARTMYAAPVLQRTNVRGIDVPVAAGVVVVVSALAVEAVVAVAEVGWSTVEVAGEPSRTLALVLALGFGLLGAFDDIAADGDDRGFRGHLRAMARGRLSTGGLKLVAGGLLALVVVARAGATSLGELAVGAVLVALAANLGNLFDRAPGRTTKVAVLCGIVLVAVTPTDERELLVGTVLVLGAGAGLLVPDLREQLMLGDAGANVLGSVVGLGVVLTTDVLVQAIVAVVLLALNVASERVSFSKVIASTPPLRALDLLGRRPVDDER